MQKRINYLLFILIVFSLQTLAQNSDSESSTSSAVQSYAFFDDTLYQHFQFPQINIIGSKADLKIKIPGSAEIVSAKQLEIATPISGNEIFKKVSGINIVEEEGMGLRMNMGIRGLDPDRSRTVLVMEDGIPVSLAPYGEPEMYYTPSIERMQRLEILKGSGSILFGPQTIGGVVNYITADPPKSSTTSFKLRGGENGYFTGNASYGTTVGNIGLRINYLHKQAEKIGTTNFQTNDFTAKLKFNLGDKSQIGVKVAAYDEVSNSTYIGITQTMFDNTEYYTVIAPNDKLSIRRYSGSLTHEYLLSNSAFIKTTIFGYTTSRNWKRQDFSRIPTSNTTGVIFGDTTVSNGAIYMRNSTGNRNRQFEVAGIEPRLFYNYNLLSLKNELDAGVRFLYERAFEQRVNGHNILVTSGDLREDEIRTGYAGAFFFQNRIYLTPDFSVTAGSRFESFFYDRDILRRNFVDTNLTAKSDVFSVVPGIGLNYNFNKNYTLFAGVHRGFAPPRIKDAISNSGQALQLEAEHSWNYELGVRTFFSETFSLELTGYMLDFSNQIIPISESSGGAGTGLVNGGKTIHRGIEAAVKYDVGKLFNSQYSVVLSSVGTFSESYYNADRFISSGNTSINIRDNRLPYSPKIVLSNSINILTPFNLEFELSGSYVGKQFTDELNTTNPSHDGQIGLMPSFFIMDFSGRYTITDLKSTLFISIKNLLDERYIASRRPQGIKVGIPRFISAGLEITL